MYWGFLVAEKLKTTITVTSHARAKPASRASSICRPALRALAIAHGSPADHGKAAAIRIAT